MGREDTWTVGELIADAVRNSRAGQSVGEFLQGIRDSGVNPHSPEYKELVESMPSMQGGRTPSRTKLSREDKRIADEVLREGKQKKGKRR